ALQHHSHVCQRPGAHAIRILLKPVFPIGRIDAFAPGEIIHDLLHLAVAHHRTHADAVDVGERHHHFQAAGCDLQQVELFDRGSHGPAADLFNNADAVVGVYDLLTNLENAVAAHGGPSPEGRDTL